jgi:hypothetical protein
MMTKEKASIEQILEKLDKGERLGIDEAVFFVQQVKKILGKNELDRFFDAARKQARKNPPLQTLSVQRINSRMIGSVEPKTSIVFVKFDEALTLNEVCTAIQMLAAKAQVAALTPKSVLKLATEEKLKVMKVAQRLAEAGLSFIEGQLEAKASETLAIDEHFSVVMMLKKFGVRASAWLPLSFDDEEKVRHLARLREFHDRTQAFTFVFLYWEGKINSKEVLMSTALTRLMLDNLKTIALTTYSLSQTQLLTAEVQQESIALGVNQI